MDKSQKMPKIRKKLKSLGKTTKTLKNPKCKTFRTFRKLEILKSENLTEISGTKNIRPQNPKPKDLTNPRPKHVKVDKYSKSHVPKLTSIPNLMYQS